MVSLGFSGKKVSHPPHREDLFLQSPALSPLSFIHSTYAITFVGCRQLRRPNCPPFSS
jgi:hypothetical protein